MTIAARQCREYLEQRYPGIRISRLSCRDTAGGDISQHSAFDSGDYDSNALDIMGAVAGSSKKDNLRMIGAVVEDLSQHLEEWSIRKILWQVPDHYGHAHVDFYPMITMHMWCANRSVVPEWRYSDGTRVTTRNPQPENGLYDGSDMTYAEMRAAEFDLWSDTNIEEAYDAGCFEDPNRAAFLDYWVTNRDDRTQLEKARFMTDYYAHLWRRA